MPMSKEEATDRFIRSRNSYYEAEQQQARLSNRIENYRAERQYAAAQISSARSEKTNFEKRLQGIEDIIKTLEGAGWVFSTNVPQSIESANSTLRSVNSDYQQCIRLTDGVAAADMEEVFHAKSVEKDANSAEALELYRQERDRLVQEIENLKRMINACSAQMSELTGKINACSLEQGSLRRTMMFSACEMARCKPIALSD